MNINKAIMAMTLAAGSIVPMAVGTPSPAAAQSNCAAGTWGSVWGWGDCRGTGKWQLKVSCTWGGSASSGIITGPGHVDVKCPIGSARNASIIYL